MFAYHANMENPEETIWQAFRHFLHLDESNAAIHTSPVRYSPLTFRLAELLRDGCPPFDDEARYAAVQRVCADIGEYEEDKGR